MWGVNLTRSQGTKQYAVMAGAFLVVFIIAVLLGLATRQLVHAIDPDEWQGLSTKTTAQTDESSNAEAQPAATREGVAAKRQPAPSYACTALRAAPLNSKGNAYAFRANVSTANGATLQKLIYSFGDGTASVTRTSASASASHTYTKAGTFTVSVRSYFTLPSGQTVSTRNALCSASISIPSSAVVSKATQPTVQRSQAPAASLVPPPVSSSQDDAEEQIVPTAQANIVAAAPQKPQPTKTTSGTKEQLPKTGAGDTLGWFMTVTVTASGAHMLYKRRKVLA